LIGTSAIGGSEPGGEWQMKPGMISQPKAELANIASLLVLNWWSGGDGMETD